MAWPTTSRHQRGYGAAWIKTRKRIVARDAGLCQPCLRMDPPRTTLGTDVHHIKAKADGGTDDPGNLELVCNPCHERLSAEQQGRTLPKPCRVLLDGTIVEC